MALTEDLIDDIQLCDTYADMIDKAADFGLSYNRKRVYDDVELAKDIDMLWEMPEVNIAELSPTVKAQVGAEVCEISGLTELIEDALEKERAEAHLSGDDLGDTSITLGQLESDATTYTTAAA